LKNQIKRTHFGESHSPVETAPVKDGQRERELQPDITAGEERMREREMRAGGDGADEKGRPAGEEREREMRWERK